MVKKLPRRGPPRPRPKVAVAPEGDAPLGKAVENKIEEELRRKRELSKAAVAAILEGIARPEMQNSVKAYIPSDWSAKYKKDLGPYKQFVKQHPKQFTLIDHDPCNFTVVKAGQAPKPMTRAGKKDPSLSWQKQLFKAWMMYCKVTPKPDRDVTAFAGAIALDAAGTEGRASKKDSTKGASTGGGSPDAASRGGDAALAPPKLAKRKRAK
uniref:Uncharacterized protein n=1 Tax=Alexandrium monilatum TaxID=311494 RepID=A0A7S4QQC3_9DINO